MIHEASARSTGAYAILLHAYPLPLILLFRLRVQLVGLTGGINIPVIAGRVALETRGGGYHLLRLSSERASARPKGRREAALRAGTRRAHHRRGLNGWLATVTIGVCRVRRNWGGARAAEEEGGLGANRDSRCDGLSARNRGVAPYVSHGDGATYVKEESAMRSEGEGRDLPAVAREQGRWRMVQYTQA